MANGAQPVNRVCTQDGCLPLERRRPVCRALDEAATGVPRVRGPLRDLQDGCVGVGGRDRRHPRGISDSFPLRRLPASRTRRPDPTSPGHPAETLRQTRRRLPDHGRNQAPCSPHRTAARSKGAAITPCCSWPFRPVCEFPSSSTSTAPISPPARTCGPGERPPRTRHPTEPDNRCDRPGMAHRTRRPHRLNVHHPNRLAPRADRTPGTAGQRGPCCTPLLTLDGPRNLLFDIGSSASGHTSPLDGSPGDLTGQHPGLRRRTSSSTIIAPVTEGVSGRGCN